MNGFGRSLGDGIVGLQALEVAGWEAALFRLPDLPPLVQQLYTGRDVRMLPWACAAPGALPPGTEGFEVLDLRDFAFDPAFRGVAMIDYFLGRLGVDPEAVPPARRRNTWFARLHPGVGARTYVLVCPRASMPLRDMPDEIHRALLAHLARRGVPAITQGAAVEGAAAAPRARTLTELAALVAGARLVVSTDTAMMHLADALAVPCVAVFTTHRPEWRVRDYPLCVGLHRPAGLPEALEFSRGPADLAATRQAWLAGADPGWLLDPIDHALETHPPCST